MEFMSFHIPDGGVPAERREAAAVAGAIVRWLTEGKAVALQCHAGIGRAPLMAAYVLMLLGLAPETAFDLIGKARGRKVPDTEEQRAWVHMFCEAMSAIPVAAPQTLSERTP